MKLMPLTTIAKAPLQKTNELHIVAKQHPDLIAALRLMINQLILILKPIPTGVQMAPTDRVMGDCFLCSFPYPFSLFFSTIAN